MMEMAKDSVAEGMVEMAEDSVAEGMVEMVEGMVEMAEGMVEMVEDSAAEMEQPKYFQSYRTNSPDREDRTCISLETQLHQKTYQFAPSLPPFQSTRKCLG